VSQRDSETEKPLQFQRWGFHDIQEGNVVDALSRSTGSNRCACMTALLGLLQPRYRLSLVVAGETSVLQPAATWVCFETIFTLVSISLFQSVSGC
jgi:hypothetical protein